MEKSKKDSKKRSDFSKKGYKRQLDKKSVYSKRSVPEEPKKHTRDIGRVNLKAGTLLSPLPAVMVSVGDMENSNIITIGWTGILSSDPPRTYISVRPQRYSHKILLEKREFVINLTTESLGYATDFAGVFTGSKVDKFEKLSLTKKESKCVGAPTVNESPLSLECRVFDIVNMGTHDVFFADIVNVSVREDLMSDSGRIMLDKAGLLAYLHGEYYSLGKKIGSFGFSAAKGKKRKNKTSGGKDK